MPSFPASFPLPIPGSVGANSGMRPTETTNNLPSVSSDDQRNRVCNSRSNRTGRPPLIPQRVLQPSSRQTDDRSGKVLPPVLNEKFSRQLVRHPKRLYSAHKQAAASEQYLLPKAANANQQASSSEWKKTWNDIRKEHDKQLDMRLDYFMHQKAQLHCEDDFSINATTRARADVSEQLLSTLNPYKSKKNCHATVAENADQHEHEHSHGLIAVDLDEAAHGAYASTKYMIDAMSGDPAKITLQFKEDALQAANAPKDALTKEIVPSGVADFAAGIGVSAGILPLAGLAIHAGIHEIGDARAQLKKLQEHSAREKQDMQQLMLLQGVVPGVEQDISLSASKAENLAFAKKLARQDLGVGVSSLLSGSAIAAKSTMDIAFKSTLVATQKKFSLLDMAQQGTQIGTAGVVTGAAGTLVLGPLAGVFATTLGIFFVYKSTRKKTQLKRDFKWAKQHIGMNLALNKAAGFECQHHANYSDFILRQGTKRIQFFQKFGSWNKAFLAGSGLYAASATTKMVVTSLALAGVGAAASNPVGLGIVLGVGIVGALVMGGASLSFITGHDKQGRYAKHTSKEHAGVDREFLVSLDLFRKFAKDDQPDPSAALKWSSLGLDARSTCLQWLDTRKQSLQEFVMEAATHHDKLMPRDPHHHLWSKGACAIKVGATYFAKLTNTRSLKKAAQSAHDTRMESRKDLGSRHIEQWIKSEPGQSALFRFAQKDLHSRANYLALKLKIRFDLTKQGAVVPPGESADNADTILDAYTAYVGKQDALIEKDQAELERSLALLGQIDRVRKAGISADCAGNDQRAALKDKHNLLRNLADYFGATSSDLPEASPERTLSKTLRSELYHDIKEARGVLFETQLEASKIRESSCSPESDVKGKRRFFGSIVAKQKKQSLA